MERQIFFINEGQRLYGMVHSPEGEGTRPGVVLYHGFTGHKMETHCIFVKLARELAAAGLHVLRFDFRGSGESEGRFEDMTLDSEISDARAALEFLAGQPGVDPGRLGVLGFSMGGLVATHVAPYDDRVRSLVLWAPAASLGQIMIARLQVNGPFEPARRDLGGNVIGAEFVPSLLRARPVEGIARFRGALLILHGTEDKSVPLADGQRLFEACPSAQKRLDIIEGADHGWSSEAFERQVIEKSTRWFRDTLSVER